MKNVRISWSSALPAGLAALGLYAQFDAAESAPTLVSHDLTALHGASRILVNPHKGWYHHYPDSYRDDSIMVRGTFQNQSDRFTVRSPEYFADAYAYEKNVLPAP